MGSWATLRRICSTAGPLPGWWGVVVGVRQDVRPGSAQTWIAFGVQGLAPYWFEVEATGYVSDGGQTAVRLEAEYELLLTNRLVVQPLIEVNVYGKSNVARGIGAGLSDTDIGLRLRYEFRREVAPYIGVTWRNAFGETRTSPGGGRHDRGGAVRGGRAALVLSLGFVGGRAGSCAAQDGGGSGVRCGVDRRSI